MDIFLSWNQDIFLPFTRLRETKEASNMDRLELLWKAQLGSRGAPLPSSLEWKTWKHRTLFRQLFGHLHCRQRAHGWRKQLKEKSQRSRSHESHGKLQERPGCRSSSEESKVRQWGFGTYKRVTKFENILQGTNGSFSLRHISLCGQPNIFHYHSLPFFKFPWRQAAEKKPSPTKWRERERQGDRQAGKRRERRREVRNIRDRNRFTEDIMFKAS